MRSIKRYGKRGFTLVELMIVVAIIGVLAALAIYGVRRYLASAKTSEAKNSIGAITRGADAAYERETSASEIIVNFGNSTAASHSLCASSTAGGTPGAIPAGTKYQPNVNEGQDFETGDSVTGWKCLRFSMNQPIYYQYHYVLGGHIPESTGPNVGGGVTGFEAGAIGDLDGDNTHSVFARGGTIVAGQLILATQVHIQDEFE